MEVVTRNKAKYTLMREANSVKGICEVLRLIYDDVFNLEEGEAKTRMTENLIDAMMMAKKMHNRLVYYKTTYNDTTGHGLKNLIGMTHSRERLKMRRVR
jgi:hypothetical protein